MEVGITAADLQCTILVVRGKRVMLDSDLAQLYQVPTGSLIQAVKRNAARFPPDFVFQIEAAELANLKSQSVISSWGGRRKKPYLFTEQGVAMLSSVLRSDRAALVNVEIMRAFVAMRQLLSENRELNQRLDELEQRYDATFKEVFEAIRGLMSADETPRKRIGFHPSG